MNKNKSKTNKGPLDTTTTKHIENKTYPKYGPYNLFSKTQEMKTHVHQYDMLHAGETPGWCGTAWCVSNTKKALKQIYTACSKESVSMAWPEILVRSGISLSHPLSTKHAGMVEWSLQCWSSPVY